MGGAAFYNSRMKKIQMSTTSIMPLSSCFYQITEQLEATKQLLLLEKPSSEFYRRYGMRCRLAELKTELQQPKPLSWRLIPTLPQLVAEIINAHNQPNGECVTPCVAEASETQLVLHFVQSERPAVLAFLEQLQNDWHNTHSKQILMWSIRVSAKAEAMMVSEGYPYLPQLLAYNAKSSAEQCLKQDQIQLLNQESATFGKALEVTHCNEPHLKIRYQGAIEFLSRLGLRLTYQEAYIQNLTVLAQNMNPLLFDISHTLLEACQASNQTVAEKAIVVNRILAQLYRESPQQAFQYKALAACGYYYINTPHLNQYCDEQQKFITLGDGEIGIASRKTQQQELVDVKNLVNLLPIDILLTRLETQTQFDSSELRALLTALETLLNFYRSAEVELATKQELAKYCYIQGINPLMTILKTLDNMPENPATAPTHEALLTTAFRIIKLSIKYHPDPIRQLDCFNYINSCMLGIFEFYKPQKAWHIINAYMNQVLELEGQLHSHNQTERDFARQTILFNQTRLSIAQGLCSQALIQYQACITQYEKSVAHFLSPLKKAGLKAHQVPDDMMASFRHLAMFVSSLSAVGTQLVLELERTQCQLIAFELFNDINRSFRDLLAQLHNNAMMKNLMAHNPHFKAAVNDTQFNTPDWDALPARLIQSHSRNLCDSLADSWMVQEGHCRINSDTGIHVLNDLAFLPYIKQAFHNFNITFRANDSNVTLLNPIQVSCNLLTRAYAQIPVLKQKTEHTVVALPAPPPIAPERPAYGEIARVLGLFQQPKVAKKSKQVKGTKTNNPKLKKPMVAPPVRAAPLIVDFGEFGSFDETRDHPNIVTLTSNFNPIRGILFGTIPATAILSDQDRTRYQKTLSDRGSHDGHLVTGRGRCGVKMYRKGGASAYKIKVVGQDDFLVGHVVKSVTGVDAQGLPVTRSLISFDKVMTHSRENNFTPK